MVQYDRAVIVGVGLLGGSIGMALQARGIASQVIGVGRSAEKLDAALRLGAIGSATTDLDQAVAGADLVVVCTPVRTIPDLVAACGPRVSASALITDVGSTKQRVCQRIDALGATRFCGSHPLAGSEKQGVEHADGNLFIDRLAIVTPTERTSPETVRRTVEFWEQLGGRTLQMTPGEHDQALAWTSHLPHAVAAALAGITPDEVLPLASSGWMDTTRIASGGLELWSQILLENRESVLAAVRRFQASMTAWVDALESGDAAAIESLLAAGKQKRDTVGN